VLFVDEVMDDRPTVLGPDDPLPVAPEVLEATVPRSGREPYTGADDGVVVRQRLFPVVDTDGTLRGVVGRDQLLRAAADGPGTGRTVSDLLIASPVTAERDDTLRAVRERFATRAITAAPVVTAEPGDAPRLVGLVTVEHLLDGRLPDLAEEHHRSRIRAPIGRRDDSPPTPHAADHSGDEVAAEA
jgi:CBS domain-containing protein